MYVLELGGEDDRFAAYEARSAATAVEVVAPGLATARGLHPERIRYLAYIHRASELVGRTDADGESARALLEAAAIEREGTVAVRARSIRGSDAVDTRAVERSLGSVLVERGFSVDLDDPDHELRALFSGDVCALGWLLAESVRDFGTRKPTEKPFFQPGSMDPLLARALVNVAGAKPGATLVDPMCGTGGLLLEAGLVGADVIGVDAQSKMVRGAARNLGHYLEDDGNDRTLGDVGNDRSDGPGKNDRTGGPGGDWSVCLGDATRLPLRDDVATAAIFDAPYGRQSKIAGTGLTELVSGALAEVYRIAPRAVIVGDRRWTEAARDVGFAIETTFERRVHRSLTRHIVVLARDSR